jgi:Rab GDP dissociation inhibitor
VSTKGYYLAMVSTNVETSNPEEELSPGLAILGKIEQKFVSVHDIFEPTDNGLESRVFVSKSYDATTHFETTCDDVVDIFQRVTGEPFDFSKVQTHVETVEQ